MVLVLTTRWRRGEEWDRWMISDEQFVRRNELGVEWQRPTVDPQENERRRQKTRRKQNERKSFTT